MKSFRRIHPYLHRYRGRYLLGMALVAFATSCSVVLPLLLKYVIDRLETDASRELLIQAALAIVGVAFVRSLLIFIGRTRILGVSRLVEYDLRNDLFAHLERLPASWYDVNTTGDITSRAINDVEGVRMMIGPAILAIFGTGIQMIASLTVMFLLDAELAAYCLVPMALVSIIIAWCGTRVRALSKSVQDQLGIVSAHAQENFSGVRIIRAFAAEEMEIGRFRDESSGLRQRNLRMIKWRTGSWSAVSLLTTGAIGLTLLVGGMAMIRGNFTMGTLTAFVWFQFELVWPMIAIGWVVNLLQRGVACMDRVWAIFDTPPEQDDGRVREGDAPIRGLIEARGLTFSYSTDRAPALRDVSFRIEPGSKVAIVGRTGAGKSTLLDLLLRLYRVPDGMLFIDGRDINSIPLRELRASIGTVPQELFLFSDRLRDNIAFGGLNGVADEDLFRAARISCLSKDVEGFPDRYEQLIGERGVTLSGGQKQRTALARALVREPTILVLDDALSSVDAHTEHEIWSGLDEFMGGDRTSIVITHRFAGIRDADQILVLDDGRLADSGRHDELLKRKGMYATLWEGQRLEEELSRS